MIVLGTVLLNATTARLIARLLGVVQDVSGGVLILGANDFAITIGKYLKDSGRMVHLVDSNPGHITKAERAGLEGIVANIYNADLAERYELLDVGYLLAFTSSDEVNDYALSRYEKIFGESGAYRLITVDELKGRMTPSEDSVFSYTEDFINLSESNRESAIVREVAFTTTAQLLELMAHAAADVDTAPLFIKYPDGQLHVIPKDPTVFEITTATTCHLVYMGSELPATTGAHQKTEPEEGR
jgi:hypothetical protein